MDDRIRFGGRSCAGLSLARIREIERELDAQARKAVGDPSLARDLVQEAVVAALASAESFSGNNVAGWLSGILSHKIADYRRRQDVERRAETRLPAAESPSPSPEAALHGRRRLDAVAGALPHLPELERLALMMVELGGQPREEVCETLGVEPGHLRVLLHRGRRRLREAVPE